MSLELKYFLAETAGCRPASVEKILAFLEKSNGDQKTDIDAWKVKAKAALERRKKTAEMQLELRAKAQERVSATFTKTSAAIQTEIDELDSVLK